MMKIRRCISKRRRGEGEEESTHGGGGGMLLQEVMPTQMTESLQSKEFDAI